MPIYTHSAKKLTQGYVALTSVLVIAVIVLVVGISTSLTSVNEIQSALSSIRNESTLDFVEGCAEDTLLRLNEDGSIPVSLTLPEGTCTITTDSQSGDNWVFTVSGTKDSHTKSIQIDATRNTQVTVNSWLEQ